LASELSFPSNFAFKNLLLNHESGEHNIQIQTPKFDANTSPSSFGRSRVDLSVLQLDPAERKPISHYNPNEYDEVKTTYIQKGL